MKYDNLPKVLREQGKFCIWKYEERQGQEKPAKVPYQINGKRAQPNNEKTFTDYTSALDVVNRYDGLGIASLEISQQSTSTSGSCMTARLGGVIQETSW